MTSELLCREDMSAEYQKLILELMESQAYRELAAAHMFGYGLRFVPDNWLRFMVLPIREETEHYEAVVKMYREFTGEEVWLRIGLLSFGRPGTAGNRYAIEGIKKRDSGECMQEFVTDIRPAVPASGLRFPPAAALAMELSPGLDLSNAA